MDFAKAQKMTLTNKAGGTVDAAELEGKVVAFYFSAHWCPPCRGFTPLLKQFYEQAQSQGRKFEIIFVSGDKSEQEGRDYFKNDHGDWLMLSFNDPSKGGLSDKYQVKGIPSFVVVDAAGKAVVTDGRSEVQPAAQKGGSAVGAVLDNWEKLTGASDWRKTAGTSLGGSSAPQASDAAAMRAARLARLGGGPPPAAAAAPAPTPAPAAAAATPTPAESAPPRDEAVYERLRGMGFNDAQITEALQKAGGDVERATNELIDKFC
eukprot:TRINITY_DN1528_c0_g1_i1.p1 TRINITY_DN1528_c0_g1~~TRINITY_DN1528_c0_g1_i1.p1  ORF type:complete len:263 (-),score=81.31 TRINITY_DN1528_c0_g1_i1:517-1305(-)